jgi:hypothetical protein
MIRSASNVFLGQGVERAWWYNSYRTLREGRFMARFPGTSCRDFGELSRVATFIKSLRDEADYERKPLNR